MIVDARGRLLGRFNLIDTAAVLCAVAVVTAGSLAYTVGRPSPPVITAVTPATVATRTATRLLLTGRHFRPYFNAFVTQTSEADPARSSREVEYLIGTPNAVELRLPPLEPGTYDIHLYDGAQEVAQRPMAFSIQSPAARKGF